MRGIAGALLLPTLGLSRANASANRVSDHLLSIFGIVQYVDDVSIKIDIPREAEHALFVPFTVTAPDTERLAIFIEEAENPLAMVVDFSDLSGPVVRGTLELHQDSTISCYALRNKQLFKSSRRVRTNISAFPDS